MGLLKQKEKILDERTRVIKAVLTHFDRITQNQPEVSKQIAAAADNAYSDDVLFEEFQLWVDDKDDEIFLHQINHYWKSRGKRVLPVEERDLTGKESAIETIKNEANDELKKRFAANLLKLALGKNLDTQEKLGIFLGVSGEMARTYLSGQHKPQMKTLQKISEKFNVSLEGLLGIEVGFQRK